MFTVSWTLMFALTPCRFDTQASALLRVDLCCSRIQTKSFFYFCLYLIFFFAWILTYYELNLNKWQSGVGNCKLSFSENFKDCSSQAEEEICVAKQMQEGICAVGPSTQQPLSALQLWLFMVGGLTIQHNSREARRVEFIVSKF